MREGERIFVDTGAWIALALSRDPLHPKAREVWESLRSSGAHLLTSVPVVLETFTFLDRNTSRDVALSWQVSLAGVETLALLTVTPADLDLAWPFFQRKELHKLSAVDATSFVLMKRERIRVAFAFDHHFAVAGFHLAG